jgi:hypothetical protein
MFSDDEKYEEVKLGFGVIMKNVDILTLLYLPPEPRLEIYNVFDNLVNEGNISLTTESGNFVKTLNINQAGTLSNK